MSQYYYGVSGEDVLRISEYAKKNDFKNVGELVDFLDNREEYTARVSLLKARIERIRLLTEVEL